MESFEEIEDNYNIALENETRLFKDKLSKASELVERRKFEKKYKSNISSLLRNYNSKINSFSKKGNLFSDEIKKKKKNKVVFNQYHSTHLDLETKKIDKFKSLISLYLFKLKLKLNKLFKSGIPSLFIRFFYHIKFFISNTKSDFFRFFRIFYENLSKKIVLIWEKSISSFKKIFDILTIFFKKILLKKKKEFTEDLIKENRERIKNKS